MHNTLDDIRSRIRTVQSFRTTDSVHFLQINDKKYNIGQQKALFIAFHPPH